MTARLLVKAFAYCIAVPLIGAIVAGLLISLPAFEANTVLASSLLMFSALAVPVWAQASVRFSDSRIDRLLVLGGVTLVILGMCAGYFALYGGAIFTKYNLLLVPGIFFVLLALLALPVVLPKWSS